MPKTSIIIPTYNHARFVTRAVESALAQTDPDREVIVVDDGSADNTRAVLEPYKGCIHYLYQENRGLSAARNRGIAAAQGDYFVFLDADDLIPANKLARQMPLLAAGSDFGLVYSGFQSLSEDGARILGDVRPKRQGHLLKDLLLRRLAIPTATAVVRRECLERVGVFDESLLAAEDTDMWIRIARAGYAFGYVDELLFQRRVVAGSMSRNHANQERYEFARLDKLFSDPTLPPDIRALKAEAYGILHYEFAAKYYYAGQIELGQARIRQAVSTCPALAGNRDWLLEWITGFALGPAVDDPHRLLDCIFDHLPPEAATLKTLRRRAHGHYHAAAMFAAHQSGHPERARPHILRAVTGNPAILRNRGFLRITLEALIAP
jgi:glycosyltransferase involved in cell wall biosynthesis